jgi:transposase
MDDQPGRIPPPPQAKRGRGTGRRPGKQPGSPGSHLAWSENPDQTVPLFPRGPCACGADLADAADLGVAASHQQVEIPEMTARVIQHDLHEAACRRGQVHRAAAPPGAGMPGTVTYGISLQAWCVDLMAAHAIPVHRCAELIAVLTGAEPSPGFVHGMPARAAAAVRYANALIRALIITAAVICAGETPIRVGPGPKTRKKYLLVARTDLLTYYFPGDRSMDTFEGFVFRDLPGAVIVHDRYQNYDKLPGVIHQLCTAHLLRDIEDAARSYPGAIWPGQSADALRALIHAASTARKQGLDTVPATAAHLTCGCSATASWRACPRYAACPARTRSNRRPGCCWNACTTVSMTSCGSCLTCGYRRLPTAPNETCGPRKPSRKYPGGSAPKPPPATGTPSAAGHLADIRGVAAARPGGSGRGQ